MDPNRRLPLRRDRYSAAAGAAGGEPQAVECVFQVEVPAGAAETSGDLFLDSAGDPGVGPVGRDQGDAEVLADR